MTVWRRRTNMMILVALFIALAVTIVSAVNQITYASDQQRINKCYQTSLEQLVTAVGRLNNAATGERRAQRDLLAARAMNKTPDEQRASYEEYLTVLDRVEQIAEDTMIPPNSCR